MDETRDERIYKIDSEDGFFSDGWDMTKYGFALLKSGDDIIPNIPRIGHALDTLVNHLIKKVEEGVLRADNFHPVYIIESFREGETDGSIESCVGLTDEDVITMIGGGYAFAKPKKSAIVALFKVEMFDPRENLDSNDDIMRAANEELIRKLEIGVKDDFDSVIMITGTTCDQDMLFGASIMLHTDADLTYRVVDEVSYNYPPENYRVQFKPHKALRLFLKGAEMAVSKEDRKRIFKSIFDDAMFPSDIVKKVMGDDVADEVISQLSDLLKHSLDYDNDETPPKDQLDTSKFDKFFKN